MPPWGSVLSVSIWKETLATQCKLSTLSQLRTIATDLEVLTHPGCLELICKLCQWGLEVTVR